MIKILSLSALSAAAALFYAQRVPTPEELQGAEVRAQDRIFLAELVTWETSEKRVERTDRDFLTTLEWDEAALPNTLPTVKAIAVERAQPVEAKVAMEEDGIPVRRAILVAPAGVAAPISPGVPTVAPAVGDGRALLARPAITQITPVVHQEAPASGRASILIYRGEVVLRPSISTP